MLKNVLKIIPICCSRNLAVGLKQNVFKPIFMVSSASIIALETSNKPKVLFHKVTSNDQYDILFGIKSWLNDLIRILKIIFRTIQMTIYLTPLLVTAPLALQFQKCQKPWLELLVWTIQACGPVYIKLGQWASTRRDLFHPLICNYLSKLQRDANIHPWEHTNSILEKYDINNFEEFNTTPIGSGCCAQVYKARITNQVHDVAIKVLHPDIEYKFLRDLTVLRSMIQNLSWIFPQLQYLSLNESLEEFADLMNQQVDLRNEARNMLRFRENFKNDKNIIFPEPLFYKEDILIETFEPGIQMGTLIQNLETVDKKTRKELASRGVNMFFKMVFSHNFVHSDLHPGNILVKDNKLIILDTGITANLSARDMKNFKAVFSAVEKGDGAAVGKEILEQSPNSCENPQQFIAEIEEVVQQFRSKLNLAQVDVSELLKSVFDLYRKHRVKVEPNFTSVLLGIMVLEGLGRTLDPELDLLWVAGPYVL